MPIKPRGNGYQITASKTVDGKVVRKSCTRATIEEAKKAELELKLQLENSCLRDLDTENQCLDTGRKPRSKHYGSWTLRDAVDNTITHRWADAKGKRTLILNAEQAVDYFGADTLLTDIDAEWVKDWQLELAAKGNSDATINRKCASLSTVLTVATESPKASGLRHKPKITRKAEGAGRLRYLTVDEEQTVLAHFKAWGKIDCWEGMQVLVDTGLRSTECWTLKGLNYDPKTKRIWLKDPNLIKTGEQRVIPCTKRVQQILETRVKEHGDERLFPGMNNHVFIRQWNRAKTLMKLTADEGFVPYVCRHTCASRLIQKGVPLAVVQRWLGHKTIQMTLKYTILDTSDLDVGVSALENYAPQQAGV